MKVIERLILASASPRRAELLRRCGIDFDVAPSDLDEPRIKPDGVAAAAWAEALAHFKARCVGDVNPNRWVLAADTIVTCAGALLGKPHDRDEAERMLEIQARQRGEVITGVCLVRVARHARRMLTHEKTLVWMRDDRCERERYLESGDWAGKAGAYGIQDVGDTLVRRIRGSFSNVVGLPVERLRRLIRRADEAQF